MPKNLTKWSRLADILADGFADDPVMNWSFGSPKSQYRVFATLARHLYLPKGAGEILQVKAKDAAACLWLDSGASKKLGLWPTLHIAASVLRHGGPSAVFRTLQLDAKLDAKHPDQPHVYLFAVAVRPGFQGKGLGKKILSPMLAHCDKHGFDAYLENSKAQNLPFYRGLGFEVVEEFAPGPGCSPLWLMLRKPAINSDQNPYHQQAKP